MNPRDPMREVLTKFGTDPPQAQGNSNVYKTLDRDRKVEKVTNYGADDESRLKSCESSTQWTLSHLSLLRSSFPTQLTVICSPGPYKLPSRGLKHPLSLSPCTDPISQ